MGTNEKKSIRYNHERGPRALVFLCAALILTVFVSTGCKEYYVGDAPPDKPEYTTAKASAPIVQPVAAFSQIEEKYELYYEYPNYIMAKYEPESGCYLGVDVSKSKEIGADIKKFDRLAGKTHAVSRYDMKLGEEFPEDFVIESIAAMKTPFVTVTAQGYPNLRALSKLAEGFARYKVPSFVEFMPDPMSCGLKPEAYVSLYKAARATFQKLAPNTAFVWSVAAQNVYESSAYYPGGEYVDWVGIQITESITKNPDGSTGLWPPFEASLEYIYYTYQKDKPIVISKLGVSHYSRIDHGYRGNDAAEEIGTIYESLSKDFPRVKMAIYFDGEDRSDNYSVSANEYTRDAYKKAAGGEYFLPGLIDKNTRMPVTQLMRSPFPAYRVGNDYFVAESTFRYDMDVRGVGGSKVINGRRYVSINVLLSNRRLDVQIEDVSKRISVCRVE